jgi:uncharacterized protein YndB with AHSA1/START domain
MVQINHTATIAAPVEQVFAAASEPDQQLRWDRDTLRSVEPLGAGPLAAGARYRGRFKGFGTIDYEFAEFDPPHRFAHVAAMPMGRMTHRFTFRPVPGGTELTQTGTLDPNLLGRLLAPVVRAMLGKRFRLIAGELSDYVGAARSMDVPPPAGAA